MPRRSQRGRLAHNGRVPSRGWGLARVQGGSMRPTLLDGDLLLVHWGARPAVGTVCVVRLPGGRPVSVKRLVARTDGGWWAERDSPTEGVDSWTVGALAAADVLGRVVGRLWPWPGPVGRGRGRGVGAPSPHR